MLVRHLVTDPGSIVMLNLRPYLLESRLGVSSHIYWKVIFVGHAVLALASIYLLDIIEHRFETAKGNTDGDNHLASTVPGSPDVVVVVPANGLGKVVLRAEELDGPSLSVVAGEDAAFGSLFRRKIPVDAGYGRYHCLPAEPVGELLRELAHFPAFHLHSGVSAGRTRDLHQRFHGQCRYRNQGGNHRTAYKQDNHVRWLQPAPFTPSNEPLYLQSPRSEEHGVRRSEEVELGVLDYEQYEEDNVDPPQRTVRLSRPREQVVVESREPDR